MPLASEEKELLEQQMLRQAAAARAGESEAARGHDVPLHATADVDAEDPPPPAYGEEMGAIHQEKNGFGTDASVGDDGRVNISIVQKDHKVSQLLVNRLNQLQHTADDELPSSLPYIPPSLGGQEGIAPPPPMNVVIQIVGSRGDVQPFVALAKVLQERYGHRVRLATHPTFKDFVTENGIEFFSIGGDPKGLMAFMVKNPGLVPGLRSLAAGDVGARQKEIAEIIQGCWRSCFETGDGTDSSDEDFSQKPFVADCLIANPPSFAHVHIAEKLGIPLHIYFTMPYSPTQAFPHPLANIQQTNAEENLTNYVSYGLVDMLTWQGLGEVINRFRKKSLGLEPISLIWAPGVLQRLKIPHTYAWSPVLIPKPRDWGANVKIAGFFFLDLAKNYTPAPDLQAFLDAGPPPVYIGFGSIVLDDPNKMTELIFEAVRKSGQRALVSKGWGGMGANELGKPDGVFMLGNVPHDWLFRHVSCVVHHGGAGTTAAGITAGCPTLIVPFFGDQPFWGSMVVGAGAGPRPIPNKKLTSENLAEGIMQCLQPQMKESVRKMAMQIAAEDGREVGAQNFHQFLDVDSLRCDVAPSRTAVWVHKQSETQLSPMAACTLAQEGFLDFNDLRLFRSREYETDEGPTDPLSGGAAFLIGTFGEMVSGVTELPSDTYRVVKASAKAKGKRPQGGESSTEATGSMPVASHSTTHEKTDENVAGPASRSDSPRGSENSAGSKFKSAATAGFGINKVVGTGLAAPMEFSVSMTKGFHNAPKLYGDDTVRKSDQQIRGWRSGMTAAGKEFGFGMYDGITGLVTQPYKGAQKEGALGALKGFGKGVGGLFFKPGAALFSIPAYSMKGVYKEMQKAFGSSVQTYLIATRTAQGFDEYRTASVEERQDVVMRWKGLLNGGKRSKKRKDSARRS